MNRLANFGTITANNAGLRRTIQPYRPRTRSAIQAVTPSDIFSWQGPTECLVLSSVGYVQLPHAVGYIVLSSHDHASYQKDSGALEKVLKTLVHLEMQFEHKPQ